MILGLPKLKLHCVPFFFGAMQECLPKSRILVGTKLFVHLFYNFFDAVAQQTADPVNPRPGVRLNPDLSTSGLRS